MENKHIQNNRNENNKENDTTKKIGKIHIQENEYIKNRNNFYNQEDIQGNVHYDSTHKEGHSHKHEELSEHQHISESAYPYPCRCKRKCLYSYTHPFAPDREKRTKPHCPDYRSYEVYKNYD